MGHTLGHGERAKQAIFGRHRVEKKNVADDFMVPLQIPFFCFYVLLSLRLTLKYPWMGFSTQLFRLFPLGTHTRARRLVVVKMKIPRNPSTLHDLTLQPRLLFLLFVLRLYKMADCQG